MSLEQSIHAITYLCYKTVLSLADIIDIALDTSDSIFRHTESLKPLQFITKNVDDKLISVISRNIS